MLTEKALESENTLISTPFERYAFLRNANQGISQIHVKGWKKSTTHIHIFDHQLVFALFTLTSGGVWYLTEIQGNVGVADVSLTASITIFSVLESDRQGRYIPKKYRPHGYSKTSAAKVNRVKN